MTHYMLRHILLAGAVGALASGCASTPRTTTHPPARPLGAEYRAVGEDNQHAPDTQVPSMADPAAPLNLQQALAWALLHSPELAAFSHEVRAAEARGLQAGLLPNPELELEIGEYDRDGQGLDSADTAIVLGQVLELGGKRRWRAQLAEAEGELSGWDYERKRVQVFTLTTRRFMEVIAAQRHLGLAVSMADLAEKTNLAVGERINAGKEPPFHASRAGAELEMARIGQREAESDLAVSRMRLAAMWGALVPRFGMVEGNMDGLLESIPSLEALRPRLASSPDLARWDAERRRGAAALSSERAARIPDLSASVAFQHFEEDGTDALAFGIGIPLPLFDRNQGNIAAAEHDLARVEAERRAAETALGAELAEAHAALTSAHGRARALRSRVVPAMQQAFESAHEGYTQGKFGFLDVLEAQRGLFKARGALVNALTDYHHAVAEIQRLTGTTIEKLLESKVRESE